MKPHTSLIKTRASGPMVPQTVRSQSGGIRRSRAVPDFFVGLAVAMPPALLLWAVVVWSIWQVTR
jgi:hypothetical protein